MFPKFPKTRPELSKEIQEIHKIHYESNRKGSTKAASLAQRVESWMHKQVARDVRKNKDMKRTTLEVGAGTLNQLQYEPGTQIYDIVEPFEELYTDSPELDKIRNVYADVSEVPLDNRYDRITTVAVLEHICNLPEIIARIGLLLADDGAFRVGIPSEGTFLWALGWKMTTGREFKKKYGLDYGELMRHEHINTAKEIEEILRYFFAKVKCKSYGLCKAVSIYQFYICRNPMVERCRQFLAASGA